MYLRICLVVEVVAYFVSALCKTQINIVVLNDEFQSK